MGYKYIVFITNILNLKKTELVMGWSFDTIPTTFKQFKEDSLLCYNETLIWGEFSLKFEGISFRSNHAWALYVDQDKQVSYLIKILIRKHQGCWGTKDIGEDAGPSVSDSDKPPKKFLKYPPMQFYPFNLQFRLKCDDLWNLSTTKDNFDVEAWKQQQIIAVDGDKIQINKWLYSILKQKGNSVKYNYSKENGTVYYWFESDYKPILEEIANSLL